MDRDSVDRDESGLPIPEKYEGERFTVFDYLSEEYADASTLEEAIALRGGKAFVSEVKPAEFLKEDPDFIQKIGIAELWGESTWFKYETERDVSLESILAAVKEDDFLVVHRSKDDAGKWGFKFYSLEGSLVPYSPYHDYDDQFFENAILNLRAGEHLVCRVKETKCFGEDGIEADPQFCWRVYSCTVTVYRVNVG